MGRKSKIPQEEYDLVIRKIEDNSCYRLSAATTNSGAFLVPVQDDKVMGPAFLVSWEKLKKLAELFAGNPGG